MLNRVVISNFKSLDVDVTLDPATVLVGRSGTGKTNFVEALRFLRQTLRNGESKWTTALLSATVKKPHPIKFLLTFDLAGFPGTFEYHLEFRCRENGAVVPYKEFLSVDGQKLFSHEGSKWIE